MNIIVKFWKRTCVVLYWQFDISRGKVAHNVRHISCNREMQWLKLKLFIKSKSHNIEIFYQLWYQMRVNHAKRSGVEIWMISTSVLAAKKKLQLPRTSVICVIGGFPCWNNKNDKNQPYSVDVTMISIGYPLTSTTLTHDYLLCNTRSLLQRKLIMKKMNNKT